MALVAWAPKGYEAPLELLVAKLPPGQVTKAQWWGALSDRIADLAVKAGEQETAQACHTLGVPMTNRLEEAGQSLVLHNLQLRTSLNLAMPEQSPFPATVGEPSQEMKDALKLDLMEWVELASSVVSGSSLD